MTDKFIFRFVAAVSVFVFVVVFVLSLKVIPKPAEMQCFAVDIALLY
jgi:putative membrane protein